MKSKARVRDIRMWKHEVERRAEYFRASARAATFSDPDNPIHHADLKFWEEEVERLRKLGRGRFRLVWESEDEN